MPLRFPHRQKHLVSFVYYNADILYVCSRFIYFLFVYYARKRKPKPHFIAVIKYAGCRCRPVTDKVIGGSILYRGITTRILHVYSVTICFLSKRIYYSARYNNSYIRTLLVKICLPDFQRLNLYETTFLDAQFCMIYCVIFI